MLIPLLLLLSLIDGCHTDSGGVNSARDQSALSEY